ncbi:post-GPI attachment to proteins factor 2-like [Teleopsis dalmanni]|uniref:post-GPI attachment to proteins factor 2-like n=1 Tax=Teleopsis dalmanni TaxID=139649 RepID=UPI0018CE1C01|nr:post-GPI attachment to proteins factor 2-like [Teleopsis dalmanni]
MDVLPENSTVVRDVTENITKPTTGSNMLDLTADSQNVELFNEKNEMGVYCSPEGSLIAKTTSTTTKLTTTDGSITTLTSTTFSPLKIQYFASFHQICVVSALLPLVTLLSCFVSALVFQYDEVHETHCRVYNIVPSISAITGVSPQRYFWRLSIAFHLGPRLPIAFIYKNYYRSLLEQLERRAPHQVPITNLLITLILILNCIEIISLGGVTYISNRENYPIHEKIFITFMICSLCHMLATIKLNEILHDDHGELPPSQRESIKWKKILFAISILSTIGLLIFFAKHRFYCHDMAFSWFAFFEYVIAVANMLFHFTIIWDFPSQHMLIIQGSRTNIEQMFNPPKKRD